MHLERLALILEIVGQKGDATVTDICIHSGLPKPSVYRLVQDLVAVGLIEPIAKGRFSVGSRLTRIVRSDQSDPALVDMIGPLMMQAAKENGVAFFLARQRGSAVEIIHVETPDHGVSYLHPGLGKRPLHACSCSKALMAFNPKLDTLCNLENRLKAYTEFTLTGIEDLNLEFEKIRDTGYAECVEELERGMCSVAAPINLPGLEVTIAIGAAGSIRVFTPAFRTKIGSLCMQLAEKSTDLLSNQNRIAKEESQLVKYAGN